MNHEERKQQYVVLINGEDQYSIWPAYRDLPGGWTVCHQAADKEDCLAYIKEHWLDMRPHSLRDAMAGTHTSGQPVI